MFASDSTPEISICNRNLKSNSSVTSLSDKMTNEFASQPLSYKTTSAQSLGTPECKVTKAKNLSAQKKLFDSLQDLTKKQIDKVQTRGHMITELEELKTKKAKLDLQSSEITLQILQTELLTKKMEMESKEKQLQLQEDILKLQKQQIENN